MCVRVCVCVAHVYKIRIKSTATNFQVETWHEASEGERAGMSGNEQE